MPLVSASHDYLPFVDPPLDSPALAAAQALIDDSLPPDPRPLHPLIPLNPLIPDSDSRPPPLNAIDTSRYELDPSSSTTDTNTNDPNTTSPTPTSTSTLQTAHQYLTLRTQALSVLDAHGRNAWLVGNHLLEAELGALEKELEKRQAEVELVNRQRMMAQEARRLEMEDGEAQWKRAVGGLVEVLVAGREMGGGSSRREESE